MSRAFSEMPLPLKYCLIPDTQINEEFGVACAQDLFGTEDKAHPVAEPREVKLTFSLIWGTTAVMAIAALLEFLW